VPARAYARTRGAGIMFRLLAAGLRPPTHLFYYIYRGYERESVLGVDKDLGEAYHSREVRTQEGVLDMGRYWIEVEATTTFTRTYEVEAESCEAAIAAYHQSHWWGVQDWYVNVEDDVMENFECDEHEETAVCTQEPFTTLR
jgi:hypothetical protein